MKVGASTKICTQQQIAKVQSQSNNEQSLEQERVKTEDRGPQKLRKNLQLNREELQNRLKNLEQKLAFLNRRLEFDVHEDTGKLMIAIVDKQTDEVVRTVPPEHLLDMEAKIREFVGLLVDEKC